MKDAGHFMVAALTKLFYVSACVVVLILPMTVSSAQYDDEILYEVLKSANLRSGPNPEAAIREVIPGGHVVALADEEQQLSDWYKVSGWRANGPTGYIHRSLLRVGLNQSWLTLKHRDTIRLREFERRQLDDFRLAIHSKRIKSPQCLATCWRA